MDGQFTPILRQKVADSLRAPVRRLTRRDVRLPVVPGKAIAVIGMRRAGKTSFLWQLLGDRLDAGTPREGLLYLGFEDERLLGMGVADLQVIVEEYYRLCPEWRDQRRAVFFLDEIQLVPGWEVFTRRLLDTESIELFISGSSAKLLSREVASSMRGRAMEAVVYPFSFREALRHTGEEPTTPPERWSKAERSALERRLRDYLASGGFPEAQGVDERDRRELLRGYVDLVLLRDVIERHGVTQPTALLWMTRQLLGNAAGTFSINKLHADLRSQGIAVAKETLHGYLAFLEDAFLLHSVSIASGSERRQRVNPRKVFPIDPALSPIFDRTRRENSGHLLETCVFLELERRGHEINYVRTVEGYEVDFLARDYRNREALIQVCSNLGDANTREREVRALLAARKDHPEAALLLVTTEPESAREIPTTIELRDAAAWLLSEDVLR